MRVREQEPHSENIGNWGSMWRLKVAWSEKGELGGRRKRQQTKNEEERRWRGRSDFLRVTARVCPPPNPHRQNYKRPLLLHRDSIVCHLVADFGDISGFILLHLCRPALVVPDKTVSEAAQYDNNNPQSVESADGGLKQEDC